MGSQACDPWRQRLLQVVSEQFQIALEFHRSTGKIGASQLQGQGQPGEGSSDLSCRIPFSLSLRLSAGLLHKKAQGLIGIEQVDRNRYEVRLLDATRHQDVWGCRGLR